MAPVVAQPLPQHIFLNDPESQSAFQTCHWLESISLQTFVSDLDKDFSEAFMVKTPAQVAARTLGYALIYSPTVEGRRRVAQEINSCNRDPETLAGLAHLYIFGLIRVFRNPRGHTPSVSVDQSPRFSFEIAADSHYETLVPPRKTQQALKDKIMHRDRRRCVFTAKGDRPSLLENHPDVADIPDPQRSERLQVAHIISQSLTTGISGLTDTAKTKLEWASSASAILDRFAGIEIRSLLGDLDLHTPINAIMLTFAPHDMFDDLGIWLEPAQDAQGNDILHTYDIIDSAPWRHQDLLSRVTFNQTNTFKGKTVEPPSPVLLALHAACARIAHLSGAADILERFDKALDPHPVLSMGVRDMSYNSRAAHELNRALHAVSFMGVE
ncbi:hypothetical protein B0H19DRAFT_1254755 [Mycena capillaripes]|nr:hypothetical protein B0H19DRAFT_1254755 [Mycena capillaripes]